MTGARAAAKEKERRRALAVELRMLEKACPGSEDIALEFGLAGEEVAHAVRAHGVEVARKLAEMAVKHHLRLGVVSDIYAALTPKPDVGRIQEALREVCP